MMVGEFQLTCRLMLRQVKGSRKRLPERPSGCYAQTFLTLHAARVNMSTPRDAAMQVFWICPPTTPARCLLRNCLLSVSFLFAAVKIRDCHGGPGRAIVLY